MILAYGISNSSNYMTLGVLEGHFLIASLFMCNISYLCRVVWSLCICRPSSCKFWGPNHISGIAEASVAKFCTREGYSK